MAQGGWQMSFTDEDLKRLKDELKTFDEKSDFHIGFSFSTIKAFIDRLEAAETLAQDAIDCGIGKVHWDAWHKTKGEKFCSMRDWHPDECGCEVEGK